MIWLGVTVVSVALAVFVYMIVSAVREILGVHKHIWSRVPGISFTDIYLSHQWRKTNGEAILKYCYICGQVKLANET